MPNSLFESKLTVYSIPELSRKQKFILFFKRTRSLLEELDKHEHGIAVITYYRYSTYKLYKKQKIWLSSSISCDVRFKTEEV